MADQATQRMRIGATPEQLWAVLTDFERYPAWAADIKAAEVVATDDQGRATEVHFRAAAMGRSTNYTLRYDYSDPARLPWELVEGDIVRTLDGHYELAAAGADATDVTYTLTVELAVPLPAFVKRRAEARIIGTALRSLRRHVESR